MTGGVDPKETPLPHEFILNQVSYMIFIFIFSHSTLSKATCLVKLNNFISHFTTTSHVSLGVYLPVLYNMSF